MITLEDKTKMFAAELRQRVAVERGDIPPRNPIGAAGGFIQTAEDIHQGRFTGTGRADNRHHLSGMNLQGDALQHLDLFFT